jgi:hypothetical protein
MTAFSSSLSLSLSTPAPPPPPIDIGMTLAPPWGLGGAQSVVTCRPSSPRPATVPGPPPNSVAPMRPGGITGASPSGTGSDLRGMRYQSRHSVEQSCDLRHPTGSAWEPDNGLPSDELFPSFEGAPHHTTTENPLAVLSVVHCLNSVAGFVEPALSLIGHTQKIPQTLPRGFTLPSPGSNKRTS